MTNDIDFQTLPLYDQQKIVMFVYYQTLLKGYANLIHCHKNERFVYRKTFHITLIEIWGNINNEKYLKSVAPEKARYLKSVAEDFKKLNETSAQKVLYICKEILDKTKLLDVSKNSDVVGFN
jgi:hypothetical protein